MSGSIRLSKEHGVNPHLTVCRVCGKNGEDIILTGSAHRYKHGCGLIFIGKPDKADCPKCKSTVSLALEDLGELRPEDRLPGLCKECREREEKGRADAEAAINEGGVPWKCRKCGSQGALTKDAQLSKKVRAWALKNSDKTDARGVPVAGIEFDKGCAVCNPTEYMTR